MGAPGRRDRRAHRAGRQRLRRPLAQAQGGPAADHGRGAPTSTTWCCRGCCTPRSCARPRRTRGSSRSTRRPPSERAGRRRGVHRRGHGRPGRAVPDGLGCRRASRCGSPTTGRSRAARSATSARRSRSCSARTSTASSTRPSDVDRRVRPAAGRRRPGGGARGRRADHPRGVRHQQGVRVVAAPAATSRPRSATPTSSSRSGSSTTAPPARRSSRAASLARVARGQAHAVELDPDPAHRARDPLDPARDHRGQDPRRRARGRRRLRLQAAGLRRGGARLLVRDARPAGRSSGPRRARRRCSSRTTGATRSTT